MIEEKEDEEEDEKEEDDEFDEEEDKEEDEEEEDVTENDEEGSPDRPGFEPLTLLTHPSPQKGLRKSQKLPVSKETLS